MNEKAALAYQRVILCSNELLSPREPNTLYLFQTVEGEIKIYPLTFTKELITLIPEQADKLRSIIGKDFDQKSQPLTFIRDQHPELVNNIISICRLHSLEPFLCEVNAIHDWVADVTRELEEANTLEEKQKILAAVLPKFTKRCRQLLANIHPDMLRRKDIAEDEVPSYTVLTQIFLDFSSKTESKWKKIAIGKSNDDEYDSGEEYELYEVYIEKLTEFNNFLREIVKELREFNNFLRGYWKELKEIRTGIERLEVGVAKLEENRNEIAEKLRQLDELEELAEPKPKTIFELIAQIRQIRQSTQNLIDQVDVVETNYQRQCAILEKKEPYYSLYQNQDQLTRSSDKVSNEVKAVLKEPDKFDDDVRYGLIAQLKELMTKIQNLVNELERSLQDNETIETFASIFNQGVNSLFAFFKAAPQEALRSTNNSVNTNDHLPPKPNLDLGGV